MKMRKYRKTHTQFHLTFEFCNKSDTLKPFLKKIKKGMQRRKNVAREASHFASLIVHKLLETHDKNTSIETKEVQHFRSNLRQ